MLYLLIGFWLLGLLIAWALVAIGGEPMPPDALAGRAAAEPRPSQDAVAARRSAAAVRAAGSDRVPRLQTAFSAAGLPGARGRRRE